jgi:putative ABC transport system ATP-binding protein
MEIFRAEHITRQFSEKFVLRNFSFSVSSGDKLNIAGRSGIGKTTLFRLLLGFDRPDSGTIYFEGEPLTEERAWAVRRKVAYVSQDLNIGRGRVQQLFDDTLSLKPIIHFASNRNKSSPDIYSFCNCPTAFPIKI